MTPSYLHLYYVSFIILTIYALCTSSSTAVHNIFMTNPSGGISGIHINTAQHGSATEIEDLNLKKEDMVSRTSIISFDPDSKQVLIETKSPRQLYYTPLCSKGLKQPKFITHITDVKLNDPKIGDCMGCTVSAFTLHGNNIYFLLTGTYMNDEGITRIIQVRVLQACEECEKSDKLYGEYGFTDTIGCSKLIVSVVNETLDFNSFDDLEFLGSKQMRITEDKGKLNFFFQSVNKTSTGENSVQLSFILWHANTNGEKSILYSSNLDSKFSSWNISSLGSVDYSSKTKTLCWSSAMVIHCGKFDGENVNDIKQILSPAAVVIASVCTGNLYDKLVIVTGVLILDSPDKQEYLFGCYADAPNNGGIGLIKMNKATDEADQPLPIGNNGNPFRGGSLFAADYKNADCDFEPEPPICLGPPPPSTTMKPSTETPLQTTTTPKLTTPESTTLELTTAEITTMKKQITKKTDDIVIAPPVPNDKGNELTPNDETKKENSTDKNNKRDQKGTEEAKSVISDDNNSSNKEYFHSLLYLCLLLIVVQLMH